MVEAKRPAGPEADAYPSKRPTGQGSGALEEDLDADIDAQQDQLAEDDVDAMMLDDDIELHLGEAGRNWTRQEPPPLDPKKDSLSRCFALHKYVPDMVSFCSCMIPCSIPADGG